MGDVGGINTVGGDPYLPPSDAVRDEQVARAAGVGEYAVHGLHPVPDVGGTLPHSPDLVQGKREAREERSRRRAGGAGDGAWHQAGRLLQAGVGAPAGYAPDAVGYVGSLAHHAVVPPQVKDWAHRPEVGRREDHGQPELLEDRQDARREPLKVHGVDEVRADLPHVLPRLLSHVVVAIVQLVGTGQALLGAAYPADGDSFELVILRLAGKEVAVGDGALGGEDQRLVSAGLQPPRQPERHDLDASAALGEELVGGEEDLQCLGSRDLAWRSACTTMDYTETLKRFASRAVREPPLQLCGPRVRASGWGTRKVPLTSFPFQTRHSRESGNPRRQ